MVAEDLNATVARVRIALIQSQVREKSSATSPPPRRRRSTSVTTISSKDGFGNNNNNNNGHKQQQKKQWIMGQEAFEARMPHHDGIKALWETKWKFPCTKSLYPFHDGSYQDFEPIFQHLIKNNINDGTCPEYTNAFIPVAKSLIAKADSLVSSSSPEKASEVYLRACTVLRIARFPYITRFPTVNDRDKWVAWELQKETYARAGKLWSPSPLQELSVPFTQASGNDFKNHGIPIYLRVPPGSGPFPTVILMTGLDGYRPDNTVRCNEFLARGWAALVVEIPGTADCPADSADPKSAERLWTSILDWIEQQKELDEKRVMVWGLSSGGYYAVRVAHTHKERLVGAIGQGAGTHYFFDEEWLRRADGHEYPFRLVDALAMKHGYGRDVEGYLRGAKGKFSLVEGGVLEGGSCRLLLVNGTMDGLMPIEDSMLLFEYGSPKEARFFTGALHMGYPKANDAVYPWMEQVMNSVKAE
ncbi:Alpha/Beta hydrolase protein [Podospora fimiseda]|uniref:Alpha/Beta hydrolase protein n=1 Tax=Podospora fimiseda TaxID=252190 RepID=A0AAN6YQ55_9PEZI|nr:Alpha/Beta hydrolase protein [Podospora fimiseda]